MSRHLDSSTTTQKNLNHGPVSKTQLFLLKRNLYGHPLAGLLWERQFEKSYCSTVGRRFQIGNAYSYTVKKGYSLSVYVDDIKLAGKKHNIDPMWKVLNKEVDLGEPTSFLDHVYLGCTQRQCEISKDIVDNYRAMFESRISVGGEREITIPSRSSYFFMVLWHGWSRKEVCGTILWVGEQDDSATLQKYLLPALMTITSKKKKWNLLENCQLPALKLFWNAYTWHELEDPIFHGQWTNLHDQSQNGPKHVTNARIDWFHTFITHVNTKQYCYVGNTAKQCRLGLFQDSAFCGRIQNPLLEEHCAFLEVIHLFQVQQNPKSSLWTLDWDLDGIPALDLWDLIVSILGNTIQTSERPGRPVVTDKSQRSQGKDQRTE